MGPLLRAYLIGVKVAQPVLPAYLRRRLRQGREDPTRWREKLGEAGLPRPEGRLVWMHAVGLGEVMALRGLIAAMAQKRPDLSFLVTSSARSSAQVFALNMPLRTRHQFLALDAPGPVARFLDHWQPDLSIWAEQDLWPGLVVAAHARGIPLALINARMNAQAFAARMRYRGLFKNIYARFAHISAQDTETAINLRKLGAAPVEVTGSLKAGAGPLADTPEARAVMAAAFRGRKTWCAASSHAADEAVALSAQQAIYAKDPSRLLVIAPRNPVRRDAIVSACAAAGLPVAVRSTGALPAQSDAVYLADTFGEMGLWYRVCPASLIGGGMGDTGGHNPWEAAHLGCAVIHGPNVVNFAPDYAAMHNADAATEARGAVDLIAALQDPALSGRAARAKALTARGMTGMDTLCHTLLALLPQAQNG